jgi:hypothetical protein
MRGTVEFQPARAGWGDRDEVLGGIPWDERGGGRHINMQGKEGCILGWGPGVVRAVGGVGANFPQKVVGKALE